MFIIWLEFYFFKHHEKNSRSCLRNEDFIFLHIFYLVPYNVKFNACNSFASVYTSWSFRLSGEMVCRKNHTIPHDIRPPAPAFLPMHNTILCLLSVVYIYSWRQRDCCIKYVSPCLLSNMFVYFLFGGID